MTTIGIDMDGIIANWVSNAIKRANKLWNLDLTLEDITDYDFLKIVKERILEKCELDISKVAFKHICSRDFFYKLEPYPKAAETVKQLSSIGKIYIVTTVFEWEYIPYEKSQWLSNKLYGTKYKLIIVEDEKDKGLLSLDYMIDDSPNVIKSLSMETLGIMVERPWNKEFIKKTNTPNVKRVADLSKYIDNIEKGYHN